MRRTILIVFTFFVAISGRELLQTTDARRFTTPCYVPDTWYPNQTCRHETSASTCSRGYNTYTSQKACCSSDGNGAFATGCTPEHEVTCYVPTEYYPTHQCGASHNVTQCALNWGNWDTQEACCSAGAAFPEGCTRAASCWSAATFYPERTCAETQDQGICQRGWGAFRTNAECCELGGAFGEGCTQGAEADGRDMHAFDGSP